MMDMAKLAERAVEAAKIWKLDLDYTAQSLEGLDRLAQKICVMHLLQPLPEDILTGTANLFGAYLGEVLLRCGLEEMGFTWTEGEEGEIGIGKPDFWMAPVTKVYKRITLGPEHSLVNFFECMFGLAIGAVGLDDPRLHMLDEEEAV